MVGIELGALLGFAEGMGLGADEGAAEQSRRGKVRKPAVTVTGEVARRLRMSWAATASPDSIRRAAHPAAWLCLRETNEKVVEIVVRNGIFHFVRNKHSKYIMQ